MPIAHKLPSGSWRCQYYAWKDKNNKWIRKSVTADTKKEAERQAALLSAEQAAAASAPVTVIDAARAYVENRRGVLSPWTVTTYTRIIDRDLQPLSLLTVQELTSERAQAFVSAFALDHSPKTTASVYGFLSSVVQSIDPDRRLRVRLPKRRPQEMQIPTKEEVQQLIDQSDGPLKAAVILASAMGLRRGEICALTWADVRDKSIRVQRAWAKDTDHSWVSKAPKSECGTRTLPIPPAAAKVLRRPAGAADTDYVVPLTPDALTRRFERLCATSGIICRFHSLRHYYASVLLALNIPDKYAMQRMGHSTTNMLKQVYQHTMQDQQQEIDNKISQYFDLP